MLHYFDAHCDTITLTKDSGVELYDNPLHINIKRLKKYQQYAGVFAIWQPDEIRGQAAYQGFCEYAAFFEGQIEKYAQDIMLCKTKADYESALKNKKIAALLGIEGGSALAGQLENVEKVHKAGVRMMTLTWNGANELCGGVMEPTGRGLTQFGKSVIATMNKLRMIVDVSHSSVRGFYDVMECGDGVVVASHSNAKALCPHPRNITDEQFLLLKKTGGGTGINIYQQFVSQKQNPGIKDVISHIEHFMSLGGEDALFLGADFDGIDSPVVGLENVEKMQDLYEELLKLNYLERHIRKIFYQNLERIMLTSLS